MTTQDVKGCTQLPRPTADQWATDTHPAPAESVPTVEEIYRQYATRVYSVAYRMTGSEADAEDVTQEVLLQVVRKLDTFRGDAQLSTWLHRVTVNAVLVLRRRRAARPERQFA